MRTTTILTVGGLCLLIPVMIGCDNTPEQPIAQEKKVDVKSDGTVRTEETTVKQRPDGTIVKEETETKREVK